MCETVVTMVENRINCGFQDFRCYSRNIVANYQLNPNQLSRANAAMPTGLELYSTMEVQSWRIPQGKKISVASELHCSCISSRTLVRIGLRISYSCFLNSFSLDLKIYLAFWHVVDIFFCTKPPTTYLD